MHQRSYVVIQREDGYHARQARNAKTSDRVLLKGNPRECRAMVFGSRKEAAEKAATLQHSDG